MKVQSITGAGLTWMVVKRSNTQLGTAEIWRAFAPSRLANVTVTANLSQSVAAAISVMSFTGIDTSGANGSGAIGATAGNSANSGAPTASLVTTRANSWVLGVGNDWDNATARTVGAGQILVHQFLASVGDTYWVQRRSTASAPAGTVVTINDIAPSGDRYNLSIVEVLAAGVSATPAPLTINSQSLPSGTAGSAYSATLSAGGGSTPYNWNISAGTLPPGLSLSAGGVISGTASTAGSYSFTAQVTDAANRTATGAFTIGISTAPSPLAITTASLPDGTVSSAYSAAFSASGGTAPYSWGIASGALPAGISLSASGSLSGTPTAAGTYSFTAQVKDANTQTANKAFSINIASAPAALSITTKLIAGGTVGTSFSATLTASGGTALYSWSLSNGVLPPGLALQSSGTISGTPSASGQYSFTVQVVDSASNSATAQLSINILAVSSGTTWYVRPDGGSASQCNGKADAAYPGSGAAQACAFSSPHYLWGNDVSGETAKWKIAGGDTVIIKNGSYRIGYKGPNSGDSWGQCPGDPYDCGMPAIPSGTAIQHTRILGENYASCTSKPELHGGYGLFEIISLEGSSNIDVQCLEITDHASCGRSGTGNGCSSSFPLSDYATHGIKTSATTTNLNLTDLDIHGLANDGIFGPVGGGITATRVRIAGNVSSGWNFDDGNGTKSTGIIKMSFVTVEWNGCAETYPPTNPASYDHCYDDNSGGYGDGVGTPDTGGIFIVDHSTFRYNTQDGLDLLHVDNAGAVITITNSIAYGNMGNQFKQGATTAAFQNNVVIGNCQRMKSAFAPNPAAYNANLSDFCRANGDAVVIGTNDNAHAVIQNNSVTSNYSIAFDIQCLAAGGGTGTCSSASHVNFDNNLIYGFPDVSGAHTFITAIYEQTNSADFMSNPGGSRRNNLLFHTNTICGVSPAVNEVCSDPLLASESDISTIDFHLTAGSPARNKGLSIPGITTDYDGKPRPIGGLPFDIGAFQF